MTPSSFKLQHSVLAIALAAIYPLQASVAASAGVAQFIAGDVNIRRADGGSAPLVKGKDIESGQAIVTGASGRAQVRFTDGGLVSLQPNTEFKVANYVDKADPKEDRFLVDLLRGSMRAVTGLIGKRNRENYKVTTTTATIGIRGSGFNAGYNPDGSLGVTTEFDGIEVCNAGGCVGLTAGESVRVVNNTDAPVRTNVRATVPTPPPTQDPVVVGNNTDSSGKAAIVSGPVETEKTYTDITVMAVATDSANNASTQLGTTGDPLTTTFDIASNKMLKVVRPTPSESWMPTNASVISGGSLGSSSDPDFVGWGSWATASSTADPSLNYFHYIAGRITPLAQMPTSGSATYTVAGYSTPTRINGSGTSFGTILSGTQLIVDFGAGTLNANINTTWVNFYESVSFLGSNTFSGTYINGFFAGADASRAGLTYNKSMGTGDTVTGAIAFTK